MIIGIAVACDRTGCLNIGMIPIESADSEIIGDKMLVLDRWVCSDCIRSEKVKA